MSFSKFNFVKKLKTMGPKIKWTLFQGVQDYKINSEYIDYLIPEQKKTIESDNEKLESMVRESIIKEFGLKIKESDSFELLVDAVVHNLKKKQLGDINDEIDF